MNFVHCALVLCSLTYVNHGVLLDGNTFLFSIKNILLEPNFFHTFTVPIGKSNSTLISYMEHICDDFVNFKNFSLTYFPHVGFYVSAFNGVSEVSGETYWEVIEHTTGKQYEVENRERTMDVIKFVLILYTLICGNELTQVDAQPPPPAFQFTIQNSLTFPTFMYTFNITINNSDKPLVTYMEEACDDNTNFKKFSMTYYKNLGVYISSFNGVSETKNVTYWELLDYSNGVPYSVGASNIFPKPGNHIGFNLTVQ